MSNSHMLHKLVDFFFFFFSSRRRHTRFDCDWSSDVCSSDLVGIRLRIRTLERAAFLTAWREKKLRGVLLAAQGAGGNAATRIEGVATRGGLDRKSGG